MLVAFYNAVKVESVPLNSAFFRAFLRLFASLTPMGPTKWLAAVLLIAVVGATIVATTARSRLIAGTPTVNDQFEQAWNGGDFDALRQLICTDLRTESHFSTNELREARQIAGRLALTVESIEVGGVTATAVIENHEADPDDIDFVREVGDWKWCEP
jgi:hypothetical protein